MESLLWAVEDGHTFVCTCICFGHQPHEAKQQKVDSINTHYKNRLVEFIHTHIGLLTIRCLQK